MSFLKLGKKSLEGEKRSFSQSGEDLIMQFIFMWLRIEKPSYLDIGAHHPTYLSNTYLFYEKGSSGVCVEPDPFLFEAIQKTRKRDICLNMGVGGGGLDKADFYILNSRTLSTFSREEAERYASYEGKNIEKVVEIPLISVNAIIAQHCPSVPNLVSLDVEGMDLQILQDFDFDKYTPEVFCIETLTYTEDNTERKLTEIIDLMTAKNYFVYADTYLNSIFVSRDAWNERV
jgi:FkbM family methyltransferase